MDNNTTENVWQPPNNRGDSKKTLPPGTQVIEPQPLKTTSETHTGPYKRLTGKQREFIRLMIENPAMPLYEVAEQAGYTGNNATLRSIASENLTKPNILSELAKYDETAQAVITEVMMYSKELGKTGTAAGAAYASNARQSAQDILDRLHGKAKQQIETTKRSVTLSIDLTGVVSTTE